MAETFNLRKVKQKAQSEARENFQRELLRARGARAESIQQAQAAEKFNLDTANRSMLEAKKNLGKAGDRAARALSRKNFDQARHTYKQAALVAAKQREQTILAAEQAERQAIIAAEKAAESYVSKAVAAVKEAQRQGKEAEAKKASEAREEKSRMAFDVQKRRKAEKEAGKQHSTMERPTGKQHGGALDEQRKGLTNLSISSAPAAPGKSSPRNAQLTDQIGLTPGAVPEPVAGVSPPPQVQITVLVNRGLGDKVLELENNLRKHAGVKLVMVGGEGDTLQIVLMAPSVPALAAWLQALPIIKEVTAKGKEITLSLKAE
jgi:hypothetical protein